MGYRRNEPPKPEEHLRRFPVRNGAIMRIAFACYYMSGHDSKMHDHLGWPNPDNPDCICQMVSNLKLYKMKDKTVEFEPIHLIEEGYSNAIISFETTEDSVWLTADAWIDEEEDNIVKVSIEAGLPEFSDKPKDIRFTVFVIGDDGTAIDAVCHAMMTVLPGPPANDPRRKR